MVKFNFGLGNDDNTSDDQATEPQVPTPTTGTNSDGTVSFVQDDATAQIPFAPAKENQNQPVSAPKDQGVVTFSTNDSTPLAHAEDADTNIPQFTPGVVPIPVETLENIVEPIPVPQEPAQETTQENNNSLTHITPINDQGTAPATAPSIIDFSTSSQDQKPEETELVPSLDVQLETAPAINLFQQDDSKDHQTPPEADQPSINPFAPTNTPAIPVEKDRASEESLTEEEKSQDGISIGEVSESSTPKENTVDNTDDPIPSLKEIKKGITGFVQVHFDNIKSYKKQINELKNKIRKEENILRSKKEEFNTLVKEIKNLAESFDENISGGNNQDKAKINQNGSQKKSPKPSYSKNKSSEGGKN